MTINYITKGDIDGDGKDEIILAYANGGGIYYLKDGQSRRLANYDALVMCCGDVDGDGKDELFVSSATGTFIARYDHGSGWTYMSYCDPVVYKNYVRCMACGDVNNDGKDELCVSFATATQLPWFWGDGDIWTSMIYGTVYDMKVGDLFGDGHASVVCDFGAVAGGLWQWHDGTWSFIHSGESTYAERGNKLNTFHIGNLDDDASDKMDITLPYDTGIYNWLDNSGFSEILNVDIVTAYTNMLFAMGDVDGDGEDESLVYFDDGAGHKSIYYNDSPTGTPYGWIAINSTDNHGLFTSPTHMICAKTDGTNDRVYVVDSVKGLWYWTGTGIVWKQVQTADAFTTVAV